MKLKKIYNQKLLLAVLILFVVSSLAFLAVIQRYAGNRTTTGTPEVITLSNGVWKVQSAVASGNSFNLILKSNVGNIVNVNNVQSYGVSNSGNMLATSTGSEIEIYNLNAGTKSQINLTNAISGDFGNVITWSAKDEFVAVAANTNKVFIFNVAELKLVSEFSANLHSSGGKLSGLIFNPVGNNILARTYRVADAVSPDLATTYLTVLSFDGEELYEYEVRGVVKVADQLSYVWSKTGDSILYRLDPVNTLINYANTAGFNARLVE